MAVTIEANGLTRRFGEFTAVDGLELSVEEGSIYGFLGPNGSGKSTCIRMFCGVLAPSAGSAKINGFDVGTKPEDVKRSIGYMSQAFSLYGDLSPLENLRFFGGIYGLTGSRLEDRIEAVVTLLQLTPYLERQSRHLSGGWKQRLALSAALLHEPPILFLDEPTAGIDPVARRDLWDLLFELAGGGKTLFVSTHYMDEAERCSEVGYIYMSKLMVHGTPADLKALPEVSPSGTRRVSVRTESAPRGLVALKNEDFVRDATLVESEIHLLIDENVKDRQISDSLATKGLHECVIRPIEPSLEDVFVTLTRRMADR